jgi:glycosyltransferase involved in cell wall biosynthesis
VSSPLVTVVTPVFNGEKHLAECVESIARQTYENWEYVIVDNASTDGTPDIAQRFSEADSRIRYERHDEFVEVNASHNRAFDAVGAESAYCKLVGADDWLYPECLSLMVELAERHPEVGVVGGYRLTGRRVDLVGLPYWQSSERGREVLSRSLRLELSVVGSATALLYRAALVRERGQFFDTSFRHADTEAAYWSLMRSDFGTVHQVVTYTREVDDRESSLSERLASMWVERLRFLVIYGPDTMPRNVYRRELRRQLTAYVRMHGRVVVRRNHRGSAEFRAFHRRSIELLLSESGNDPELRRALGLVRVLIR